ncbi:methyltransferase domain-containing protein [Candidatus Micrarchaeota archaeon]|nr:methyltransferase domain-containing protein [Candidatus Micrarchaeota archaeon]MBD3417876.1 methyltransferase domain-containing protein [Candidatus Micrarchaeota archaeon]
MHGKNPISSGFRKGRYHLAVSMVEDINPKSILDIGCGEGHFLSYISGGFPGAKLYGCDRRKDWVDKAKKACPDAEIHTGDFMELELKPADLVVALEMMEHNDDPAKMIKKAAMLAGKNGWVLISIPRPELFRWRITWWLWTHTVGRWGLGEHTNLTESQLIDFAKQAGLRMEKPSRFFFDCISTMPFRVS